MTTRPSQPESVPPLIWNHADEVLRAEEDAAKKAAGPLRRLIAGLLASFRVRWGQVFGRGSHRDEQSGADFAALMGDLSKQLQRLDTGDAVSAIVSAATAAQVLGQRQAYIEAGLDPIAIAAGAVDLALIQYARAVVDTARALIQQASRIARTMRRGSFSAVAQVVSVAQQGANGVERGARSVVNTAVNQGAAKVAETLDARKLWVAERDACVHCLGLSGHLADEDTGLFNSALTFGRRPLVWIPEGGLTGPPRHPNCRCRITPWFSHDQAGAESITHDWAGAIAEARANGDVVAEEAAHRAAAAARASSAVDLPESVRREAERSVLTGWSMDTEPNSVRIQAAERLLAMISADDGRAPSGWRVPKTVLKGARRDVKKGTIARAFPG